MPQASGVFKQLTYKVEATYGTVPAASAAQALRRVTSDLSLTKDTYQSNEIRTDQQVSDFRHGVRRVAGNINGELSPGTYGDFIAAALRKDWASITAITGVSVTIASIGGGSYTVTRGAGSFLSDNVKKGDVIRLSVGSLHANNINKNLFIIGLTATVATVRVLNGSAMQAEGPIASTTISVIGKRTYAPTSGHTNKSYSIEHWHSDVSLSEVFSGCQPTQIELGLPPTGIATIGIGFVGQNITTAGAQYFTSPTAATTTGLVAAVNGVLVVGGTVLAAVTGLQMTISSARSGDPVVGSNVIPTQFPGRILASGQLTAYFEDATLRDAFLNESDVEILVALSADNTATSKFVTIALPRVKFGGASKSDGESGIVQTMPFTALLPTTGGSGVANEMSTVVILDSDAV